ncbi:MAG TPA: ATP-binding protein [Tepidisphaeraceae bacterium]|jgi:signal transduction histidine kinase|nr:ATP-binding protein [Tepidisphaeraceae bacterium]
MDSAFIPASATEHLDAALQQDQSLPKAVRKEPWWALPGAIVLTLLTLALDLVMPRGASPDIGYCAAVLMAATTGRIRVLLILASFCSALTIIGYHLEPHGPGWMDVFDRAMVIGVILLTAFLGWRRLRISQALRRQAEVLENTTRQLARSNADLERFATVVSHDLRSPLTALSLNLQLLARQLPADDEDSRQTIGEMRGSIDDMSNLIRGLLEHGRASHERLDLCDCDVAKVLNTVLKRLAASLQTSGGQVTHGPLPPVRADQGQLMSLFQNLIENAVKYRSAEPPRIQITARPGPCFCTFSVCDNGMGIDPHHQQRIFQIFERAESSRGGAGVGLAVCKSIVERHGGKIWVESRPGRGSTFSFTIPNSPPNTPEAQTNAPRERTLTVAVG